MFDYIFFNRWDLCSCFYGLNNFTKRRYYGVYSNEFNHGKSVSNDVFYRGCGIVKSDAENVFSNEINSVATKESSKCIYLSVERKCSVPAAVCPQ